MKKSKFSEAQIKFTATLFEFGNATRKRLNHLHLTINLIIDENRKLFNVLESFGFNNVNNPEFKEDSVREEIIVPILKGLGYSASKPYQIVRSRGLLHPFVSIGSKKQNIYIVLDYLFEVNDKPAWILDAKSPAEQHSYILY